MQIKFNGVEEYYGTPKAENLQNRQKRFETFLNDENYGFLQMEEVLSYSISRCRQLLQRFSEKNSFIQVGIGGSALGPEMLVSALKNNDRKFTFINNIDPDRLYEQLNSLNYQDCLFYIVSKSGSTAETMANFSIITNWLEGHNVSPKEFKKYMVFSTDPQKGDLYDLAKDLNIQCLEVPLNIGGRYSVLSSVGMLSATFAGIDIEKLAEGYKTAKTEIFNKQNVDSIYTVGYYVEEAFKNKVNQTVIMPYSSKLRNLSDWFVQLWAESLGKKLNLNNECVETGLTPISSYGATDQHSQMQLFMEGPRDKMLFIIELNKFKHDFSLQNEFQAESLKKLSPFSLSQLLKAELEGTMKALQENNRPFIHFQLQELNEMELASLILKFESLTAMIGDFLSINPLNQPGVEAGKRYAHNWLLQNINKK